MDRRRIPALCCALLGAALCCVPALAGGGPYWRYTDAAGNVHFVDALERVPAALRGHARAVGQGEAAARVTRIESRPPPERRPFEDVATTPAARRVVVYSARWCGWCRRTFAWMDARGIAYENRDIEADPANRDELIRKTGRTAIPVVEIGGEVVRGYRPDRWQELL
jgi:glutaredoxin